MDSALDKVVSNAYIGPIEKQATSTAHDAPNLQARLSAAGLRPTKQRMLIGAWLFSGDDKHFTAEDLHRDMVLTGRAVSLATIYNTLGTFTEAGLLHTVNVESGRMFYDTNTKPHFHIYDQGGQKLTDICAKDLKISGLPDLPEGQSLDRIDIVIRTKQS